MGLGASVGTIAAVIAAVASVIGVCTAFIALHRSGPTMRFADARSGYSERREGRQYVSVGFYYAMAGPVRVADEHWTLRYASPWPWRRRRVSDVQPVHAGGPQSMGDGQLKSYVFEFPAEPVGTRVRLKMKISLEPHGKAKWAHTFTLTDQA